MKIPQKYTDSKTRFLLHHVLDRDYTGWWFIIDVRYW